MHLIRKAVVLAFAGFGIYKAVELAKAKFTPVRERAADAKARIEPALHETEDTVHAAADEVATSIQDLGRTVADTIADAVETPLPESSDSAAPVSSRP